MQALNASPALSAGQAPQDRAPVPKAAQELQDGLVPVLSAAVQASFP
jgi:hypothetical protein